MSIRQMSNEVAVCGQITPDDVEAIAELGFKTIVNNRPDHELSGEFTRQDIEARAKSLGLAIHYLPLEAGQVPPQALLEEFNRIMAEAEKPVLAYCRSGTRSGHIYQGACALK